MKHLTLILFLGLTSITFSQNKYCEYETETSSLGIGLLLMPQKYSLFKDSSLSKIISNEDMYALDDESPLICAKFSKADYEIMHFICLENSESYFKILYNNNQTAFVPKDEKYTFKSWKNYIRESYGVRRQNDFEKSNPLKTNPNTNAVDIIIPDEPELLCVFDLKGDWIKVQYDCFYNSPAAEHEGEPCHTYIKECGSKKQGWVRWRRGNKLLIDIFLMP